MGAKLDYYVILGVAPTSEDVVIQAAYRALMRRYHPDANSSPDAAARAQAINQAYSVLGNPAKRAQYDSERTDQARKAEQSSSQRPPPPPPPETSPWSGRREYDGGSNAKQGLVGLAVCAAIIALIAVPSLLNGSADASDQYVDADDLSVENLAVENLIADDATADYGTSSANYDMATDWNIAGANMNSSWPLPTPTLPPSLSRQEAHPVRFGDIEDAAKKFAKILMTDGMAGARRYSEDCHRRVTESPTWSAADNCAAFDLAAAYVDSQVSAASRAPSNGYFRFQRDNQADHYAAAGASAYLVRSRLSSIRSAAEPAATEAVSAEIAEYETRTPTEPAPVGRPATPPAEFTRQD